MKLLDFIPENAVIHCPTYLLAKEVLSIFNNMGLRWSDGESYITNSQYDSYKEETCYSPYKGEFCHLNWFRKSGVAIIPASLFIEGYTGVKKIRKKPLKYFTTQTLNIAGHQRDVTIAVLWDIGTLHAGYAVRNPIDTVVNSELAKTIAIGRALSERTNLLNGENLGTMSHRYILKAIAESLIRAIEAGHIKIKGVK